ncbi:MAG: DnaJ domain-containing protein [Tunicatimonas sp.]
MREQYLRLLDLPLSASEKEIKQAYRRLAKRYHPDRSADPAAHERFVEIAEAYQFLTEPEFTVPDAQPRNEYSDPFAEEYERRRRAARLFAQQQAAELLRQRLAATLAVNRILMFVIPLVALTQLLFIVDHQLPPRVVPDEVVSVAYGQSAMTGLHAKVYFRQRTLSAKYENISRVRPGDEATIVTTPWLGIVLWAEFGAPDVYRVEPAYGVYQGYRLFITWILILCLIFALLPMRSDNKVVAGAVVLLFFAFQLGLLW